jgi:PAS domain S-box-containing protein
MTIPALKPASNVGSHSEIPLPLGLNQIVKSLRARLPSPVFQFVLPLGMMIVLTGATYLCYSVLGWRTPVFGGIVVLGYILLLLEAAWMGYGPGLLVLLLMTILPRFFGTAPRTLNKDAVRYLLGAVICGLISRLGQTKRRREAELKHTAEELEVRVRERTERLNFQTNLLEQINAREEAFRSFLGDAPFAYHEVDNNGVFVRVNRVECEVLGLSAAEIVGRPVWDFATPEEREESRDSLRLAIKQRGTIAPFQRKRRTPQGESVFQVHSRLITNPAGEVTGVRTAMLDLTEASHARQQVVLQTNVLDQINDAVMTVDKSFCIKYFNAAAERLFGWSAQHAAGQPYRAVAGTVVTQAEREAIHADILDRGSWNGEIICTNREGRRFVVNLSWSVLRDRDGNPTAVVGIHRDLTAPKQMEQALRDSQDRLQLAQSALSLGIWELDLATETVQCSEQLLRLYGIFEPREAMSFEEWNSLVHPDDRPESPVHGAKALFEGGDSFDRQLRVVWPDGSVHWLHSKSRVIVDEFGEAHRVIGADFDITEHKQTEERLHILSSAVEQCPVSVLIANLNNEIEYVNARLTESTGYTLEELKGEHPGKLSCAMPPEHFDEIAQAIQTGQWQGVVHTTRKNGELFWESVTARPIRDARGNPTHTIAVAEDITERLEMESALKLSEERFRIVAESSGDSIYEWDLISDLITTTGALQPGTDVVAGTPYSAREFRRQYYHPDDRERVEAAVQRHLEHGEPFRQEVRLILPSGEIRYFFVQGSAVRDATGRPIRLIGASRDITDQKKVERANAQLAVIVENADAAIISNDLSGAVLTWNRGAERIYGYSAEEMIGRTMSALVPPDRCGEDAAFMRRLQRGERIKHVETMRLTKSGDPIPVLLTLSPMQDRQGNFLGIAHVAEDITHVKELERQLAQTQNWNP